MQVRLLLFAHLQDIAGREAIDVELNDGAIVNDIEAKLVTMDTRFEGVLRYARPARNGEWASGEDVVFEGDEIALLPPSSGG
jgi:molybdopterin converting factor small subunit